MRATGRETGFGDIEGLAELWGETLGEPEVRVAVLDGPVDETHSCFQGARLTRLQTLVPDHAGRGGMSVHGTHVASEIFGQPGGPIVGIAPGCHGLILPIFADRRSGPLAQLDLTRAIEQAVDNGAHVINISAGERSATGDADDLLARAVRRCEDAGVLICAAAGNDGCECLHVPAALGSVLAVGAVDRAGQPLEISNWGKAYQTKGVLAPGEHIRGALPGGGTALRTGTSFATPIVSGVVALLLSIQHRQGRKLNPLAVRDAIIASARPCNLGHGSGSGRCLAGLLNIPGAYAILNNATKGAIAMTPLDVGTGQSSTMIDPASVSAAAEPVSEKLIEAAQKLSVAGQRLAMAPSGAAGPSNEMPAYNSAAGELNASGAEPSQVCVCQERRSPFVFAIGTIGYDFGTEARKDSFRQLMPISRDRPANPYATEQMISYLAAHHAEATKLIWTFNLELTPIYAIEPELPYAPEIHDFLRGALNGQIQKEDSVGYVSRISLSGQLTNRTVRLYSGQVVPVVVAQSRGLWSWTTKSLIDAVVARFDQKQHDNIRMALQNFLNRIYYELRNLGQTSPDRALNFSATNAFQAAEAMSRALHPKELVPGAGLYMLADISIVKSPFCRMDSDCWDVKLTFFDPENERRAASVMRFTVDVSDELPVTLGPVRHWAEAHSR